jgi:uncharacterized protein with PIN domain
MVLLAELLTSAGAKYTEPDLTRCLQCNGEPTASVRTELRSWV